MRLAGGYLRCRIQGVEVHGCMSWANEERTRIVDMIMLCLPPQNTFQYLSKQRKQKIRLLRILARILPQPHHRRVV
jgi:hypothetical protein